MRESAFLLLALAAATASAFPPPLPSAEGDGAARDNPPNIRSLLITKHNFAQRQRKSHLPPRVPEPFVVSTQLNVKDLNGANPTSRRGRTWTDGDGHTVVEGVRVPDDESDKVNPCNSRGFPI